MANYLGKFIVIDGTDGSGKTTQTKLLVERLINMGFLVEMADFPQYNQKSAGLVEEYLNGRYGSPDEVGPYRASIFYACDRYDASLKIKKWLEEGKIVIANRYVASNMGHQGGKIKNGLERKNFFDWLYKLEYELFNIPMPDLNVILHVDAAVAQKLVDKKGARDYVGGIKRDIHEADIKHLKQAEMVYLEIASSFPGFKLIECAENNQLMPVERINGLLLNEVLKIITPKTINRFAPNFIELEKQIADKEEKEIKKPLTVKIMAIEAGVKIPTRAYAHDAGLDLYANDYYSLFPGDQVIVRTGIKMAIPEGCAGLIWDKGGIAKNGIHAIAGVVDSGFRGEITVNLINLSHDIYNIAPGQKVAQMLIQKVEIPEIITGEVDNNTDRGEGRFGSSGLY